MQSCDYKALALPILNIFLSLKIQSLAKKERAKGGKIWQRKLPKIWVKPKAWVCEIPRYKKGESHVWGKQGMGKRKPKLWATEIQDMAKRIPKV